MILFFGTRPGKRESKLLKNVRCPYCEQIDTMTLFITSNFVHFFWIKIFKISTHVYAICSHCKRHYDKAEFTDEMKESFRE